MTTLPDRRPLVADVLRAGLDRAADFYSAVEVTARTGSTNADLLARAGDPAADRTVLIADCQDHGRGRHSRSWQAPPRSQVALSVLLRLPGAEPARLGWLPLLTGVAVVDALRRVAGVPAGLKWPNDVLIGERKVAGILAEVGATGPVPVVVVGVGINVDLTSDELPVPHATSLALAGARTTDRNVVAQAVLAELADRITDWQRDGWAVADPAAAYRERCVTLGTPVRAELPGGTTITGIADDVDRNGRLLIDGTAVSAADVTHLRAQ
ncbi:biotin--[acetyl-CoA-carboxylase] ligase [Skermania piniformis]|uniref:biotin--[biotin carboxyl-carrier protein] ligase n=1 Tax=Skermania pinensis TaxID=39122 RepID=A0ABX8S6C5_9ACTN|nr:biotin--[acetyl-CoA-carboxylase] ligase [Skermania piniformis]QXQ13288.1 biotin--[acetyl-CoA-carboxylase] ligase [Skermania piniformis]